MRIKNERIIRRVKELRDSGLYQTEIASVMGISQWSVSKILNEKKLIDTKLYDELMKIKKEKDLGE
jgi:predicted transcriptional regulator